MEIHDGLRHLRPYLPEETRTRARDRARRAAIAAALRLWAARAPTATPAAGVTRQATTRCDTATEALRLARISQQMTTSPYVAAELARLAVTH